MLDVPATEKIEIRTYKIITGQASEVARNLQQTLHTAKGRGEPVGIPTSF